MKTIWINIFVAITFFLFGIIATSYGVEIGTYVRNNGLIAFLKYGGWFSTFLGLIALVWQVNQASQKMEIDLLLKMSERFDSEQMLKHRVRASKLFLANVHEEDASVDAVLNFFEEVDFLVEKRSISPAAVWHYISYWITGYFWVSKEYREQIRNTSADASIFVGIENLYERMLIAEKAACRKKGWKYNQWGESEIKDFLQFESNLLGKPQRFRIRGKGRDNAI